MADPKSKAGEVGQRLLCTLGLFIVLPTMTAAQNAKRVLIADRDTWEASSTSFVHGSETAECHQDSGCGENGSLTAGSRSQAGIRRVNTEQVKNLNKACPDLGITNNPARADYFVVWDVKTFAQTSWTGHQNEFTIYDKAGDLVGSGDAHTISGAAKNICKLLQK